MCEVFALCVLLQCVTYMRKWFNALTDVDRVSLIVELAPLLIL